MRTGTTDVFLGQGADFCLSSVWSQSGMGRAQGWCWRSRVGILAFEFLENLSACFLIYKSTPDPPNPSFGKITRGENVKGL